MSRPWLANWERTQVNESLDNNAASKHQKHGTMEAVDLFPSIWAQLFVRRMSGCRMFVMCWRWQDLLLVHIDRPTLNDSELTANKYRTEIERVLPNSNAGFTWAQSTLNYWARLQWTAWKKCLRSQDSVDCCTGWRFYRDFTCKGWTIKDRTIIRSGQGMWHYRFDLETTGLDWGAGITQVAANIEFLNSKASFIAFILPSQPISKNTSQLMGITVHEVGGKRETFHYGTCVLSTSARDG